jgi:16S rRNA (adenine1518-N6/adenine1519-N6)-dimethyltransferase
VPKHVTPSVAGELLARHDLRAGVRHGQHFLVDPNTVRRIVRIADVQEDETILEIGPGLGSLTVALAEAAERVVAIELDTAVARALDEVLADVRNVDVVVADAMDVDLAELTRGPARLVANLPYNVATPLFLRVLQDFPHITGGLVMVQREIGERWTAQPGSRAYNAVTVRARYHAGARIVGNVPKAVFMPPPKVESVLVAFSRHTIPPVVVTDERAFFAFVIAAFAHRRKTLRNSLAAAGSSRENVERTMRELGLDEQARPEDLSLDDYARLHTALGA